MPVFQLPQGPAGAVGPKGDIGDHSLCVGAIALRPINFT
jgi:hypothetical protein